MSSRAAKSRILDPEFLLNAYCNGYFPMANPESGEIAWYSPDPRTIFELSEFKIPRSLKLTIKKGIFEVRLNTQFEEVMRGCAARDETWISEDIIASYLQLYRLGFGHSVECWHDGTLAGGLYGVAIGGAFFGESMFSLERDASKVALVSLTQRLKERNFELLDTQYSTPHLIRFGAREIPKSDYMKRLKRAIAKQCKFV